ncbi:IPExxxVDY family protein [Olivibacter sp. 47]|uniref:IPExxxVDY family protein n=1 Tax=Olivibacter sp. 47 TaxID=3056486 RepID=UPI0025A448E2|nr:IPExxxVDY family protein [Olivibacter sp. 47]MDM8177497.1 IPExxxVDY family protein [Olivibacter sp. 47]
MAITCPLKDYRLCYYINKVTGLDLHKIDDHEIWQDNQHSFYFGRYYYEDSNNEISYYL